MSSVLFDVPGPAARRRHNLYAVVAGVLALAVLAWAVWKLYQDGQFDSVVWEGMSQPNIWRAIWQGLSHTLSAAVSAIVLSVLFGGVLALARLSDHGAVRWPATVVVEFFRAVPLLLLILFIFLAYPALGAYWALVLGLMLYNGSVLAEVFRAGINAVPKGQAEASYAIGMRKNQVMRLVLLPQAVRIMLPAIVSQCVIVLKDTALGVIIAYGDLVREGTIIAQFLHRQVVPLLVVAVIFILVNYSLSRLAVWLERRMSRRGRSAQVADEDMSLHPTAGGAGD